MYAHVGARRQGWAVSAVHVLEHLLKEGWVIMNVWDMCQRNDSPSVPVESTLHIRANTRRNSKNSGRLSQRYTALFCRMAQHLGSQYLEAKSILHCEVVYSCHTAPIRNNARSRSHVVGSDCLSRI
jgi:hypothetical protein